MKKSLIIIISLLTVNVSIAQTNREKVLEKLLSDRSYCDSTNSLYKLKFNYTNYQYLTNYSINRLIRQDLTKITLNEDGMPSVGNYATLKYSEDNSKITLNTSWYNPFKKSSESDPIKNILSINIKAGISDGVAALFADKNLNSGVGIKAKMTFLTRNTFYESSSVYNCNVLALYRNRLLENYKLEYEKFRMDSVLSLKSYGKRIEVLRQQLHEDSVKLLEITEVVNNFNLSDSVQFKKNFTKFSGKVVDAVPVLEVQKQMILLSEEKEIHNDSTRLKFNKQIQEYNLYIAKSRRYNRNETIDLYYKQLFDIENSNVKWKRFSIEFWNVDVSLNGEKYNIFDKSLPVSDQLSKQNFTGWSVGASFNHFGSNTSNGIARNGYLYKIGYSLSNSNNFIGAKTKSITSTINIDTPSFKREVVSKVDAYEGTFRKFYAHNITMQLSKYLNEKKTNALSLYSSLSLNFDDLKAPFKINGKPYITTGTGYTLSLLDKEKTKAVVNFELYFNLYDVLNSLKDKETKFYQRREIGLKIGVPFSSIFLN